MPTTTITRKCCGAVKRDGSPCRGPPNCHHHREQRAREAAAVDIASSTESTFTWNDPGPLPPLPVEASNEPAPVPPPIPPLPSRRELQLIHLSLPELRRSCAGLNSKGKPCRRSCNIFFEYCRSHTDEVEAAQPVHDGDHKEGCAERAPIDRHYQDGKLDDKVALMLDGWEARTWTVLHSDDDWVKASFAAAHRVESVSGAVLLITSRSRGGAEEAPTGPVNGRPQTRCRIRQLSGPSAHGDASSVDGGATSCAELEPRRVGGSKRWFEQARCTVL